MPDPNLDLDEYLRYGRQMIVPEFGGLESQQALRRASVLVVGAGGLGCPAIAYLAGAGVGTLTIVDGDTVEASNLHRQVVHSTATVGQHKAASAAAFVRRLNPHVAVRAITSHLTPTTVFDVIRVGAATAAAATDAEHGPWDFDLVLDCTDNPQTRYLVNDAAVLARTPLVSASALKTEGQLCVLNYAGGPCYRCLFPAPPPPDSVVACGDGGILGPVVGMMGVYQALEAVKILAGVYAEDSLGAGEAPRQKFTPSLMIFSALSFPPWRCVRMRGAKKGCVACDESLPAAERVSRAAIEGGNLDYVAFCGHTDAPRVSATERVSAAEYQADVVARGVRHVLIDVRPRVHFGIASLPHAVSVPLDEFDALSDDDLRERVFGKELADGTPVYVVCRYGNDSQPGVTQIKSRLGVDKVWDIIGGLDAWSRTVDPSFPRY